MPKGQKIVDWTPENEAKLFHTIIAVHDIKVDNAKVAKAFGPNVPASCIITKMGALRKKAAAMGIIPSPTPVTNSARTVVASKGKKTEATIKEEDGAEQAITPPDASDDPLAPTPATPTKNKVISGRVKKPRASPRKTVPKNYKKIVDPFVEMEDAKDENGQNVFGEPEQSESEDTVLTDGEFETAAEDGGIKAEEDEEA